MEEKQRRGRRGTQDIVECLKERERSEIGILGIGRDDREKEKNWMKQADLEIRKEGE